MILNRCILKTIGNISGCYKNKTKNNWEIASRLVLIINTIIC